MDVPLKTLAQLLEFAAESKGRGDLEALLQEARAKDEAVLRFVVEEAAELLEVALA